MATISKRETVGNVAERTSINSLCELKHDTDFFQRHAFNHQPELRTLGFFVHCWECLLREERKPFHATTFVLHGCVCGIVLRHLRAHVADNGLDDRKRDSSNSSIVAENPSVFSTVFEAWQKHRRLHIVYSEQGGEVERDIDPHVLFLYLHEWRIKAYCHLRKAPRTFVINRIKNANLISETFKPNHKIIDSVTLDEIVSYRKIPNVVIRLTGDAVKFAKANLMHSKQKVTKKRDGTVLFTIPEVPAEVVVPWILSQKGEAVPLEPPEIVEAVRKGAQATLDSLAK